MTDLNKTKITFLGAAGTVTGSKYLIEANGKKIMIDCGLFQGLKELRLRNWANLPFDAAEVNCVILTHGHLDHVGYLPLLVKQGFKGSIYGTAPTLEIAKLILLDSARINEEDAEWANLFRYSKHEPVKPLYSVKEAEAVLPLFVDKDLDEWSNITPEISFRYKYNGHIIGATFVELDINKKRWVFSGDIGRENDPLLYTPNKPSSADYLIIESTYGGRFHPGEVKERLADVINKAFARRGPIIIPSFAVERAQLLMYYLWQLKHEKKIPAIPIYLDSPMGTSVLDTFRKFPEWHKLSAKDCEEIMHDIRVIKKQEETKDVARDSTSKIVIAASGMASGGRVLTYFENSLNDPTATILIVGFQGEGTRGRALLEGVKELRIRGKFIQVKASVQKVEGLSAHADQNELISWMSSIKHPEKIFIVHGEKSASENLKTRIKEHFNCESEIPQLGEEKVLGVMDHKLL
jgi:metallo-beta-lactamase family protein